MEISTKAIFLTALSKPYEFDGNKGVSHRVRFSVDGEIYVAKSTESQVASLNEALTKGEMYDLVVRVVSKKEAMSLEVVSFE